MTKFSEKLTKNTCLDIPRKAAGVYEISCLIGINRTFGRDPDGILYIGKSKRIGDRITHFWACAEGKIQTGHPGGMKYFALQYNERINYNLENLRIRWREEENEASAIKAEAELLDSYTRKFGEVPPLNSAKPKSQK